MTATKWRVILTVEGIDLADFVEMDRDVEVE